MAFEVASVKPTAMFLPPNFAFNNTDGKPSGGRLSASFTLWTYISFAYKLTASRQQERAVLADCRNGSIPMFSRLKRARQAIQPKTRCG
jgi:uncharacterized protein (TIGR03435 family)